MAVSIFTNQTPSSGNLADAAPGLTLGTCWYSNVPGYVTGIRWRFPATLPAVAPTGLLYQVIDANNGTQLASKQFTAPVAGTWNEALFDDPEPVAADTLYMAAVHTGDRYVATGGFFTAADLVNGDLVAIRDATNPTGLSGNQRNGRFESGAAPAFPTDFFGGASYFVDVLFVTELETSGPLAVAMPALTVDLDATSTAAGPLTGGLPPLTAAAAGAASSAAALTVGLPALAVQLLGQQPQPVRFNSNTRAARFTTTTTSPEV